METELTPEMREIFRKMSAELGREGGKARARNLSAQERTRIARLGGQARARQAKARKLQPETAPQTILTP